MSEPERAVMRAEVKRALGNLHQYSAPLRPFLDREVDAVMEIVGRLIEGSDPEADTEPRRDETLAGINKAIDYLDPDFGVGPPMASTALATLRAVREHYAEDHPATEPRSLSEPLDVAWATVERSLPKGSPEWEALIHAAVLAGRAHIARLAESSRG